MTKMLLFLCCLSFSGLAAQQLYTVHFDNFEASRGNADTGLIAELPQSELIIKQDVLRSRSGLGMPLNFHGNIVVIDQMDVLPDGSKQITIRREDGKDFFGYRPTLRAILKPVTAPAPETEME